MMFVLSLVAILLMSYEIVTYGIVNTTITYYPSTHEIPNPLDDVDITLSNTQFNLYVYELETPLGLACHIKYRWTTDSDNSLESLDDYIYNRCLPHIDNGDINRTIIDDILRVNGPKYMEECYGNIYNEEYVQMIEKVFGNDKSHEVEKNIKICAQACVANIYFNIVHDLIEALTNEESTKEDNNIFLKKLQSCQNNGIYDGYVFVLKTDTDLHKYKEDNISKNTTYNTLVIILVVVIICVVLCCLLLVSGKIYMRHKTRKEQRRARQIREGQNILSGEMIYTDVN